MTPIRASSIAGGDLSEVLELELADGRVVVAKGSAFPAAEAEMLDAIRATGAPAPVVHRYDGSTLVLERLPNTGRLGDAWGDLGISLARLHAGRCAATGVAEQRCYGWHCDYAFGSVAIENRHAADWPTFWAERRLVNQAGHVASDLARRIERLAADLSGRLPMRPPPALLHGDLWSGNILVAGDRISGLIDPACYYGDREVDFAMLGLFTKIDSRLFEAAPPLPGGGYERMPVYQLWPALVHLRLFGSAYRPLVERLLASLGV